MEPSRTAIAPPETQRPPAAETLPAAQLAKGALRRLAMERLEPTPENYARAYRHESGDTTPPENPDALALLLERLLRGVERGGRSWTVARRKDGVQRVIAGARRDPKKLQQRLGQLIASWEDDQPAADVDLTAPTATAAPLAAPIAPIAPIAAAAVNPPPVTAIAATEPTPPEAPVAEPVADANATRAVNALLATLRASLPDDETNRDLVRDLDALRHDWAAAGPIDVLADRTERLCSGVDRVVQHRHHLFAQLHKLCGELTASLADFAEDGSWVAGQCTAMRTKLDEGLSARGVRQVSDMLHHARARHVEVKGEREKARDALKLLIQQMLAELGELGSKTGNFHASVGRYAEVIEEADSLESLTGVVREMVAESRAVQSLVQQTQERLQEEHSKAMEMSERVSRLEDEMRRLSDEVSTDQLTQVSNRRGLLAAFEVELARLKREGGDLSIGLLDIDNFKRLNDELGHSAGDEALKSLASVVSRTLRPTDRVARYGGEEFVVLLPTTAVAEGQQILTRLQRSLSGGLFMHKDENVFVTFSAGVTAYRMEERIEQALERADQALYEAKRTGKNRTCIG